MDGSRIIQKHVLVTALDAGQNAVQSAANKAQSALTPANYEFLDMSPVNDRMVRLNVKPRRSHVSTGKDASAVAYVESRTGEGQVRWGIGVDPNILTASFHAVISTVLRQRRVLR